MEAFQIVPVDKPDWNVIGDGIHQHNTAQAGDMNAQTLCFVVQDSEQTTVGGVIGQVHWDWLNIDLMWIQEDLRGQGYGQQLLQLIEDKAREFGAENAYLDTFSFQAPDFYQKYGYRVFGELKNFPTGHQRYYLTKEL
jgi:GNAT superfamily N-acetyltransferase